jgi:ribosomal protein S3
VSRGNAVARVYNLREEAVLFLYVKNRVHAEHFHKEHFISMLAYLSDISEKFSTLNTNMQRNDANIIVVTDKVKAFIGKLGSWVRKLEAKSLDMFSRSKNSVEENSVETTDTRIDQCYQRLLG